MEPFCTQYLSLGTANLSLRRLAGDAKIWDRKTTQESKTHPAQ